MTNIWRIARWELLRNLKNKTFIISLLLTPFIFLIFAIIPSLITLVAAEEPFTLYVYDEYNVVGQLQPLVSSDIILIAENDVSRLDALVQETKRSGYISIDAASVQAKNLKIYTQSEGELMVNDFGGLPSALQAVFRNITLREYGLSEPNIDEINAPFTVRQLSLNPQSKDEDPLKKYIPAILAGLLYFNIFISSSLMFTSIMQEKKDRMAEIILSSVPAQQFMQGKIFGHFLLSLIQIALWLTVALPAAYNFLHIPVLAYLATWQLIPIILFTFSGCLLFFSCFAALGATMEDASSGSNFQSIIFLLPMLPLLFFGPVIVNPNGNIAIFCSYFPFTSPLILPLRTALTHAIPLSQYLIGGAILALTCFLMMVASGKIFRASILLYGKNASLTDMLRWLTNKA